MPARGDTNKTVYKNTRFLKLQKMRRSIKYSNDKSSFLKVSSLTYLIPINQEPNILVQTNQVQRLKMNYNKLVKEAKQKVPLYS